MGRETHSLFRNQSTNKINFYNFFLGNDQGMVGWMNIIVIMKELKMSSLLYQLCLYKRISCQHNKLNVTFVAWTLCAHDFIYGPIWRLFVALVIILPHFEFMRRPRQ